ncbi:MAG: cysteine-rich CWC family protein [Burkholderiales bacterium]
MPAPEHACPVCGGPNDCAPARTGDFATRCWCSDVTADPDVLAALPAAVRHRACLCRRCLTGQPAPAAPGEAPA